MGVHPFSSMPAVMKTQAEAIKAAGIAVVKLVASAGAPVIIDATPVDTTKAVGNWKVTSGNPFQGVMGERVAGSKKGSGASAARSGMKSEAAGRIEAHKQGALFIANNVPYISVLEYGDSKHRPHGMVDKGLQAMRVRASSIRILNIKP